MVYILIVSKHSMYAQTLYIQTLYYILKPYVTYSKSYRCERPWFEEIT